MTAAWQAPQITTTAWWVLALALAVVFLLSVATVWWPHQDVPAAPVWPERGLAHRVPVEDVVGYDASGEPVMAPHRPS